MSIITHNFFLSVQQKIFERIKYLVDEHKLISRKELSELLREYPTERNC